MGLEGSKGYSRQTYEDTRKEIEGIAHSVSADTSPGEMREKFAEQTALVEEKEALHNEAWDQAEAEDAARTGQREAAELLQKMHENAGSKRETTAVPNAEKRQEKQVERETAPSPEKEMEKLYSSLDLAQGDELTFNSRKSVEANSGASLKSKIEVGLAAEEAHDDEKRGKFFKRSLMVGGAGAAVGVGGVTFLGATATTLGFATGGAALGVGILGWAGMKAYHAIKEGRHRKAFDKLRYG